MFENLPGWCWALGFFAGGFPWPWHVPKLELPQLCVATLVVLSMSNVGGAFHWGATFISGVSLGLYFSQWLQKKLQREIDTVAEKPVDFSL